MNHRSLRVGELIKNELSVLMIRELEFGEGVLVTVTDVNVQKDLDRAVVMVSVLPSAAESQTMKILKNAKGELQHLLLKRINIKPMPRIEFMIDHGPEDAARIEKLLIEDNNK